MQEWWQERENKTYVRPDCPPDIGDPPSESAQVQSASLYDRVWRFPNDAGIRQASEHICRSTELPGGRISIASTTKWALGDLIRVTLLASMESGDWEQDWIIPLILQCDFVSPNSV